VRHCFYVMVGDPLTRDKVTACTTVDKDGDREVLQRSGEGKKLRIGGSEIEFEKFAFEISRVSVVVVVVGC